jgi:hypothetical protein
MSTRDAAILAGKRAVKSAWGLGGTEPGGPTDEEFVAAVVDAADPIIRADALEFANCETAMAVREADEHDDYCPDRGDPRCDCDRDARIRAAIEAEVRKRIAQECERTGNHHGAAIARTVQMKEKS